MENEYLRRIAEALERIANHLDTGPAVGSEVLTLPEDDEEEHTPPPSWLNADNLEQLSAELEAFSKAQMPESAGRWLDSTVVAAFWETKGLRNIYVLEPKERLLIERIQKRVTQIPR